MSTKTKKHLTFVADVLEGSLKELLALSIWGGRIVGSNVMERKPRASRTRRQRQPRPRIERVVVYRQSAPRLYVVDKRK